MNLFEDENFNLLPYQGELFYHNNFLSHLEATQLFDTFIDNIPWEQDKVKLFGKTIVTKRKVAWFGDKMFNYTYSGKTKTANIFTKDLSQLKTRVETLTKHKFNSCLLNLYHTGNEGMGWHSDNEKELGNNPIIASISLGAERKFSIKHKKSKQSVSIILNHGSLLLMGKETQQNWLHSLPKTVKVKPPRINLTFRNFKG